MRNIKKVTKIDERTSLPDKSKTRVAAYCRVSTKSDEQLVSLDTQRAHYEEYIKSNDEWEYVGIFYDEGITGTKKDGRNGLLSLIKKCEHGLIDIVITKSISRFSRNTTDCLELVRKLLKLNVRVIFEKEKINTGEMESELMLSIFSSLAEDESVSISENNKWSIQKSFLDGSYVITYPPYGYKNVDKKMVIVPEQAEVVKSIFEYTLAGNSTHTIARILNEQGILSKRNGKWVSGSIIGIIRNEKYTGDVLYQKTYTDSQFKRHINNGIVNQYLYTNHHEAIISHEVFDKANKVIAQRTKEKGNGGNTQRYQNRYEFSSKIRCGECGGLFKRRKHYQSGGSYVAWTCSNHINDKQSCSMLYITDESIKYTFITMMNKLIFGRNIVLIPLLNTLKNYDEKSNLLKSREFNTRLEKVAREKQILSGLMSKGLLERELFEKESNRLYQQQSSIEKQKSQSLSNGCVNRTETESLDMLYKKVSHSKMFTKYDEKLFTDFIEEIEVVSRDEVIFIFKCGLKLKERLVKQ